MKHSQRRCRIHDEPVGQASICRSCVRRLERDLGDIPALDEELEITETRQAVGGARNGSRATTTPLPYSWATDHDRIDIRLTLAYWVHELGPEQLIVGGPVCALCQHGSCATFRHDLWPAYNATALSSWLLSRVGRLAQHPQGDVIADEIGYAVHQAYRAIDRRPDRWYAGPCRSEYVTADLGAACCLHQLYVEPDAETFTCPQCATEFETVDRKTDLLAWTEDQLFTATWIAGFVSVMAGTVTPERIWKWAERGRLTAKGVDAMGRPTYRVGDVIDRLSEDMANAERRSRKPVRVAC